MKMPAYEASHSQIVHVCRWSLEINMLSRLESRLILPRPHREEVEVEMEVQLELGSPLGRILHEANEQLDH